MKSIESIEEYLLAVKDDFFDNIKNQCVQEGAWNVFLKQLKWLDCTRWTKDGKFKIIQTIGYPYCYEMTNTVWIIKNCMTEEEQDKAVDMLLERHKANKTYEMEEPPIWYSKKKFDKNNVEQKDPTKRKTVRSCRAKSSKKEDKELIAAKKLKERIAKINVLSFKIKPQ